MLLKQQVGDGDARPVEISVVSNRNPCLDQRPHDQVCGRARLAFRAQKGSAALAQPVGCCGDIEGFSQTNTSLV